MSERGAEEEPREIRSASRQRGSGKKPAPSGLDSGAQTPRQIDGSEGGGAADDGPDVLLDVPTLNVDEIDLKVENLRARVSLQAEVLDLLKLNVGADVELGAVTLTIKGVEAQALLKVRLDNVAAIIERVLQTIDENPQIIENVTRGVESSLKDVGAGAGQAAGEIGRGAGGAVEDVGRGAGSAVEEVGEGVGGAVESVGEGAGGAVEGVGEGAGGAVEGVGRDAGDAVEGGGEVASRAGGAGQTVEQAGTGADRSSGGGDAAGTEGAAVGRTDARAGGTDGGEAGEPSEAADQSATRAGDTGRAACRCASGSAGRHGRADRGTTTLKVIRGVRAGAKQIGREAGGVVSRAVKAAREAG